MRSSIGVDHWRVPCTLQALLLTAQSRGLQLYAVKEEAGVIRVCVPLHQRNTFRQCFPQATLVHTSGVVGFVLRNMRLPSRILSLLVFVSIWLLLSQFVFTVEIVGDSTVNKETIDDLIEQHYGEGPFFALQEETVEAMLEEELASSLAWTEADRVGSHLTIRFTSRRSQETEEIGDADLIAQRDGVIAGFDLSYGNKCVNINDVVKKGDVLVSSSMLDSLNREKHLLVKGRVFAYTWETVEVSCKSDGFPQPFQFFRLLLAARAQVSEDFLKDDRIERENILQFEENAGTIRMKIHYTVYRDISSPV